MLFISVRNTGLFHTPYLYLEIEMLLIDRFSVFGYLEISNLF